jgi:transcriptional regulator with XRE-family HTH domain
MLQDHVSAEIRAELARRSQSQERLAQSLGWTLSKLNRRLKGRVPWAVADVELVALTLGVPQSQLLDPVPVKAAG